MGSFRARTRRSASLPNDPVGPRTSASSVEPFTLALWRQLGATKQALSESRASLCAAFDDQCGGTADSPVVLRECPGSARDQGGGRRRISQETCDRRNESVRRVQLDYSASTAEFIHQVLKVFHVRTYYDWLSGHDGFHRILATNSTEAFPDHYDARRRVP